MIGSSVTDVATVDWGKCQSVDIYPDVVGNWDPLGNREVDATADTRLRRAKRQYPLSTQSGH